MRGRTLAFALALLSVWMAQPAIATDQVYVRQYELDALAFTYCNTTAATAGRGRIVNVASSTTITTVNALSGFGQLAIGDEIFVTIPVAGVLTRTRLVVAAAPTAGNSSIVVSPAVDLSGNGTSGYAWDFTDVACGTGAESGWLLVANSQWTDITWQFGDAAASIPFGNVTGGIDVQVECRGKETTAVTVYPDPANSASTNECLKGNFTAANACRLIVTGHWSQCRVGLQIGTADDGADTGADAESVSVFLNTGPAPL